MVQFKNPEFILLIAIARLGDDFESLDQIESLVKQKLNLDYLLELANHHGMLPLLYLALKEIDQDLIPDEKHNFLKNYFFENTQRNLSLLGELLKLIKLLKDNDITTIPFKGPILSKLLYDSFSIRQAGDLDILVKSEDVLSVVEILKDNDFHLSNLLSRNQQIALVKMSRENRLILVHPQSKLTIEVHWRLYTSDLIERTTTNFLWKHLENTTVNNIKIKTLKPEIRWLFLCFHNYKHNWERLFWIWELGKMINKKEGLDWDWVFKQAHLFGDQKVLILNLLVIKHIIGTTLPQAIEDIKPIDQDVANIFNQIIFEPERNQIEVRNGYRSPGLKTRFRIKSNPIDRAGHFLKFAFTPNIYDIQSIDLPPLLHPLYFVIRPFRLVYRFGQKILSR